MRKKKQEKKPARRICQHCGAKRNIDQLELVDTKIGSYFQSGRNEIKLYVCKLKYRRFKDRFDEMYCNGEKKRPEIFKKGNWHN